MLNKVQMCNWYNCTNLWNVQKTCRLSCEGVYGSSPRNREIMNFYKLQSDFWLNNPPMEWNNLVVCILLLSESWIPLLLLLLIGKWVNGRVVNCQSPLCPLADHWMDPTVNLPLICLFRALLCSSMGLGTSRWIRVYSSVRRSGFLSSGEGGPLSVGLRDKSSASIHSPPQCTNSAKLTVHGKNKNIRNWPGLALEHFSQLDWLLVQGRCQVSSSRFILNQLWIKLSNLA